VKRNIIFLLDKMANAARPGVKFTKVEADQAQDIAKQF
jgi:thioredoxin-like negative regulator of GroEL